MHADLEPPADRIRNQQKRMQQPIDIDLRGTPADGVSLTSDVMDTIAAGQSIGDAQDDEEDYEGFEEEHGGDTR